ncbi:MAG: DUF1501 domain-containing protein [Gammaproteobacteria bacterium]|nr:DUF1501 domain-containing protein [Gammaproteobacteria bacterium]MDH3430801.1 DUF1501 domain-containing protein [Gammaproteobacteria bacterium]MDH3433130.1 DUF1501 domain-containing protein [Gammaproteobacteria bacterium]
MLTRRQFLGSGCAVAAMSGSATLIGDAQAEISAGAPGYRALVCISLGGGADSFNMLVPTDASSYRDYAKRRGDLALNHNELLPLRRGDSEGRSYALHYGMREVHELYSAGKVALLANAGPLQGPVRRPGSARMPDLSHSDLIARWHHGTADRRSHSGWAGRVADVLADCGWQDRIPTNISMSGRNVMQLGACSAAANLQSSPYQQRSGLPAGVDFSYVNEQLAERAISAGRPGGVRRKTRLLDKIETESRLIVEDAVADTPEFKTRFAPDSFSTDLEQVARIIAARSRLGVRRQMFFVHFDGWDHHHKLLENQAMLLPILSRGLAVFRDALIEHDAFDDVTTFTISEFGRSLESNGSGSDHGWGGHHIVMGGAVHGGRIYGHYPHLANGSPLDIGGGVFAPTTSTEEYFAELALWFGIPASQLQYVLPNISAFYSPSSNVPPLGFLA